MGKTTLTDFSQLSKAFLKPAPEADAKKPPLPKPTHDDGEEALAYFSRSPGGQPSGSAAARPAAPADSAVEDLKRELAESRKRLAQADLARESAQREIARLQGECGRLRGELRKAVEPAPAAESPAAATAVVAAAPKAGLLDVPADFAEAFPGELREMVLAALSDALGVARQGTRERRATVLDAVLAANRPSGELERRRVELRQILKDAGYYTDPRALASLGFKLISGRTHWKLEYADVRIPIAKTPSDYRSGLNASADMANRCF